MTKTKKDKHLKVRINSEDYSYFKIAAELMHYSVSDYLRKLMDASITAVKIKIKKGELDIENFKSFFNDKL